jgi:uroporphyrinogen-III synthase
MALVLVLRPEPGASATASRARELGLNAIAVPLFTVEPIQWDAPEPSAFDGLLLTSANAVRHGGVQLDPLRSLKVYAVGPATAEAALGAGLDVAVAGEGGVDRLLAAIPPDLHLLHLCGADRRDPKETRHRITPVVVYRSRQIESPALPRGASIALIHSPRAGRRFAELVRDRRSIAIVAISQAAADATGEGWKARHVADAQSDEALLALAARLCNNPQPK